MLSVLPLSLLIGPLFSAVLLQERDALLPAVATLLRATPAEFRALRSVVAGGSWWPAFAAG